MSRQQASHENETTIAAPSIAEHMAPQQEPPSATGGGPATTMEPARGIAALERYFEGKDTSVNRFALEGLTYEHACPYLTQEGIDSVDTLADLLLEHKEMKVTVESFTDSSGSDEVNADLSQSRAEMVKRQLVMCGVEPSRIETVGRGAASPVANNDSDDGRARNRRTEVILHK